MINLTIDGVQIEAKEGQSILSAAKGAWNPYSYTLLPGKN